MIEIINEFVVNDINKTIDFYKKYFGFELIDVDGNPITWCKMKKDNCYIMFEKYSEVYKEITNFPEKTFSSNLIKFKLNSKDEVENLYKKIKKDQIATFMELKNTDYGSLEFGILDPDKNMIILSC